MILSFGDIWCLLVSVSVPFTATIRSLLGRRSGNCFIGFIG